MTPADERLARRIQKERREILQRLEDWLEWPMVLLGFAWLVLLIVELVRGLNPFLETAGTAIWILFVLDFVLKLSVAPVKLDYLKRNWFMLLSLTLPALRVFRVARAVRLLRLARTARGLRLIRIFTSTNRGMKALGASMERRGFGYAVTLTLLVLLSGAAGMYAFERAAPGGFDSYGDALWWTAMLLTSLGSDYWPRTGEGRMLCLMLATYGFAVFGYVTAVLASFFVEMEAESGRGQAARTRHVRDLKDEIAALRVEVRALRGGAGSG